MDEYDPDTVFSSIDRRGRYAYANQPVIAEWNLTRLAECLLPLLSEDRDRAVEQAKEALSAFAPCFEKAYQKGLRRKIGLLTEREGDITLGGDLLKAMSANAADFTLTFRGLTEAVPGPDHEGPLRSLFREPGAYDEWAARWRQRLEEEPADATVRRAEMRAANPAYIPRNHRVEAMIRAAVDQEDFGPFDELLAVLATPFEEKPAFAHYAEPPKEHERVQETFCGT